MCHIKKHNLSANTPPNELFEGIAIIHVLMRRNINVAGLMEDCMLTLIYGRQQSNS